MGQNKRTEFAEHTLQWYKEEGRHDLPWRNSDDVFHILMAEFMLQKTQADQVKEVFTGFIQKYPDPKTTADAPLSEIKKEIEELGLLYRAERIKRSSQQIVTEFGGKVPKSLEELKRLNGVGNYIAYSVLIHGYGKSFGVVDTNTSRIIKRVFDFKTDKRARTDSDLWKFCHELTPAERSSEYNYGLLDLGAKVCNKNNPLCEECPQSEICLRFKNSEKP